MPTDRLTPAQRAEALALAKEFSGAKYVRKVNLMARALLEAEAELWRVDVAEAKLANLTAMYAAVRKRVDKVTWRCFHCGFVAETTEDALKHFGARISDAPRCLDVDKLCEQLSKLQSRVPDDAKEILAKAHHKLRLQASHIRELSYGPAEKGAAG